LKGSEGGWGKATNEEVDQKKEEEEEEEEEEDEVGVWCAYGLTLILAYM